MRIISDMPLPKAIALMAGLACLGVLLIADTQAGFLSTRTPPLKEVAAKVPRSSTAGGATVRGPANTTPQPRNTNDGSLVPAEFPTGPGMGTLELRVTDTPAKGMGAISLTISKIDVQGTEGDNAAWTAILDAPLSLNVLGLAGLEGYIATTTLPSGTYAHLRLTADQAFGTTPTGPHAITLSSNNLQPYEGFVVETGKTTVITLDFATGVSMTQARGDWTLTLHLWAREPALDIGTQAIGALVLPFYPLGSSTQNAIVNFLPRGSSTEVFISLTRPKWPGGQTASLRAGSCQEEGAVKRTLAVVHGGTSDTTLDLPLNLLRSSGSSIWVRHPKEAGGGVAVCADLPLPANEITIELDAVRGSSISGWATITPGQGNTAVSLRMVGDLHGDVPVLTGPCGQLGKVVQELGPVAHGRSNFQAPLAWQTLTEATVSIAMHMQQGETKVLAACGVIPRIWASRLALITS